MIQIQVNFMKTLFQNNFETVQLIWDSTIRHEISKKGMDFISTMMGIFMEVPGKMIN